MRRAHTLTWIIMGGWKRQAHNTLNTVRISSLLSWTYVLTDLGNQHPISHAVQTNHGQNDPDGQKGKRSFTGKKWVTGTGLVDDESVAKRDVELNMESFPWIPESGEDEGANKRSPEEEAHESFPWIPESEEDEEDNSVSKRDTEEEHESFPWIQ